jgi:hypothetical protein
MQVLALGIDYGRYLRFRRLVPVVHKLRGHRRVRAEPGYAPTREEYDECVQFVIAVSLRMAELEKLAAQPSWRDSPQDWPL